MSYNLCIWHAGCADGFGAATVVAKALPHCVFGEGVYGDDPPNVAGAHVYLVDFSYRREVVEAMLEQAESVTIIDHHKSAMKDLEGLEHPRLEKHFNTMYSGAVLTWLYFFPEEPIPQLLLHIQDRDLWKKELPNSDEICAALYSHEFDFKLWDEFYADQSQLIIDGKALLRDRAKHTQLALATEPEWVNIDGYKVPVLNASRSIASELAQELAVLYNTPFAGVYQDRNGKRIFSLRSRKGFDVSEVAFALNGGGHQTASGINIPIKRMHSIKASLTFRIKRWFVSMFTL